MQVSELLNQMDASWPSPIVSRDELGTFTGGLVKRKTVVNRDSLGTGPAERIRHGRKVAYPKAALLAWLEAELSIETPRQRA